ncbi:hypothetical protein SAMN05216516_103214 [Izhakiella capsodis]|uniref:Uncharacterized protein n=1 Tax=Izhakiella capsodis TaxID=1367852 RepID=A0A1I4X252_9GAMM|nr:hypothetical protein [Izhakiella capsodis]SFN19450.1 hypothetical protein SAMN05216516_103214 [Izhakiella capsodis]
MTADDSDDILFFAASRYGVAKLYENNNFTGRDLLQDNNGYAQGFNKISLLYAKALWGK